MKRIYYLLFVILFSACTTSNRQTVESLNEPKVYNTMINNRFFYPLKKDETITYVIEKFSNSPFYFEQPENNLEFLVINYSANQPDLFIDCGKTTITNMKGGVVVSKKTFVNTKNSYNYQKYRKNHNDTYDVQSKLLIRANIITSSMENHSNIIVQPRFFLKVRKSMSSTQGMIKRENKKYKLQLASGERKLFEAYDTKCTSTGRFEKMVEDILLPTFPK